MNSRNKTILISLVILILIIGYHMKIRYQETSERKVKFHVYEYSNRNFLNSYLRKIPILYDSLIKVERTDRFSKDYTLYKVDNNIFGGTPSIHYLTFNKDNGEINELKSESLLKEIKNLKEIDLRMIHKYMIDLNEFNYVYSDSKIEKTELFEFYARLISNVKDSIHFREIKDKNDIDQILINFPKETYNMSSLYESELIDEFDFLDSISENQKYYWYFDKGIIRFRFKLNEKNELEQVESYKIGNLGNEILHM